MIPKQKEKKEWHANMFLEKQGKNKKTRKKNSA